MDTADGYRGWVLVEARLEGGRRRDRAWLHVRYREAARLEDFPLPVAANGRICELVRLDGVAASIELRLSGEGGRQSAHPLTVRRVGRFERIWRMAARVRDTARRLSRAQRARLGLSARAALFDLAGAYRIAVESRLPIAYPEWIDRFDRLDEADVSRIRQDAARFEAPPHFHLLVVAHGAEEASVRATLDSLQGQLYRNFSCAVQAGKGAGEGSPLREDWPDAVRVTGEDETAWLDGLNRTLAARPMRAWVLLLRAGDVLAGHALYRFACASRDRPDAAVIYSDDDALDGEGRRSRPRFKPDWSPMHLRSTNYIGEAAAFRGAEVAAAGGIGRDCCRYGNYDLLLRVADRLGDSAAGRIEHLPAVLLHRSSVPSGPRVGEEAWQARALQAHLTRNGTAAEAGLERAGVWRIRYRLPEALPLVSVIVPMRDALALTRRCVESLLERTAYSGLEVLVADNRSRDPEALAYLDALAGRDGVRVLRYDRPFNYSAINNFAVRHARGEVLCLLNNDTEVITPRWVEEMLGLLCQPGVGIVGAKLLYPGGAVQHGGDLVGVGEVASHAHAFLERDDPGYLGRARLVQEMSAVTGACLMVWKSLYEGLGGLDEANLPVAFNDVDFCLRARQAGWRVVWTPHAELYHDESATRGRAPDKEKTRRIRREAAWMRRRWKRALERDPFYNANLSRTWPDFALSRTPLIEDAVATRHENATPGKES